MKIINYLIVSLITVIFSSSIALSSDILKTPPTIVGDNFAFTEGSVWVGNQLVIYDIK